MKEDFGAIRHYENSWWENFVSTFASRLLDRVRYVRYTGYTHDGNQVAIGGCNALIGSFIWNWNPTEELEFATMKVSRMVNNTQHPVTDNGEQL